MKRKTKKLRAAVVGYGGAFNMGLHHLREMEQAGIVPAAVCDVDVARLMAAEADFPGIATFTSLGAMLKEAEAGLVTLITPHNLHAKQAVQCLEAGKHVVVEKPMAIRTAECDTMIAAAKKHRRMLSTYHNRHWDGCILQAVKTIRAGAIGEPYRVVVNMGGYGKPGDWWRSLKSVSGGILHDWGVHLLEYTLQIVDAKIVEVSGFAHRGYWAGQVPWGKDANEDEAAAVIRFSNGAWAWLCISSLGFDHKRPWIEITGTKGSYAMEHDDYSYTTLKGKERLTRSGRNPSSESIRYYQNVADHLTKDEKLVISPEWARRPIHIIDLACQSAAKGHALKAKYG